MYYHYLFINSLPSADNFCKVWTQIRPDKMSGLIWIQTDTLVFLKEFFEKVDFEKKSADDKKNMQNYPVGKEWCHMINHGYMFIT